MISDKLYVCRYIRPQKSTSLAIQQENIYREKSLGYYTPPQKIPQIPLIVYKQVRFVLKNIILEK